MLPDIRTIHRLFIQIGKKLNTLPEPCGLGTHDSLKHYLSVAHCAKTIARACGMNAQKAFMMGLLHDSGEYIEKTTPNTFHGTAGYDRMTELGYDDIARACLVHSFFEEIFDPEYFSYDRGQIARAGKLIAQLKLNDYDRLVQLSDLLSIFRPITIEDRLNYLFKKYNLPEEQRVFKLKKALALKDYFDKKCKADVYKLLKIK